jgi:hypothetical protein
MPPMNAFNTLLKQLMVQVAPMAQQALNTVMQGVIDKLWNQIHAQPQAAPPENLVADVLAQSALRGHAFKSPEVAATKAKIYEELAKPGQEVVS